MELLACVHATDDDYLCAELPMVPGCHTFARTMEELEANVVDAARLSLEDYFVEPALSASEIVAPQELKCVSDFYSTAKDAPSAIRELSEAVAGHYKADRDGNSCGCNGNKILCEAAQGILSLADARMQEAPGASSLRVFRV